MKQDYNILKYRILRKTVFIVSVLVFVSIFFLNVPNKALGAVIYDSSNIGTPYNVSSYVFINNLYMRFPYATSSYPYFPTDNYLTLTAPIETLRVKRISGVACNVPSNVGLIKDSGNSLSVYTGVANGDFCDFRVMNTNVGDKFMGIALCVNGYCDGRDGDFVLDGSDTNAGYSFNGNGQNPTPGGVAFQLCDSGGCSGGFNNPTLPPPEPSCTENCNSSVMFLPGVMGSRLFEDNNECGILAGDERWISLFDCNQSRLAMATSGKSVNLLYTKEGEAGLVDSYAFDVYRSFMNKLSDWKNTENLIADYSLIPYDWRLSLNDILENGATTTGKLTYDTYQGFQNSYIYKKLKELQQTSRTKKVTIAAHSNGGLVAKALIQKLKDANDPLYNEIDNLILVAVPQSGTPDAINALLHGKSLGPNSIVMKSERMRDISQNMPGAYQLLPSSAYFSSNGATVSTPIVTFESGPLTNSFISLYGYAINDVSTLKRFLVGEEGRLSPTYSDLSNPARLSSSLITQAENTHQLIDNNWISSASTTIYQIAGWGMPTLATVKYKDLYKCTQFKDVKNLSGNFVSRCVSGVNQLTLDLDNFVDGDGTVVIPSALAMSTSSPNVKRLWIDLDKYASKNSINRDHGDIFEVSDVVDFVKNIISTTSPKTYDFIKNAQPPSNSIKRLSFTLHSPLDLSVRDLNGNEVSSTTKNIPNGIYRKYGEVQYISVPSESNPVLSLQGFASGSFDLDIKELINNTVIATTTFASILSATSTTASISFTDGTIFNATSLSIDYQGDGVIDESLEPKVGEIVTLPPVDGIAPESKIIFSTSTNSIFVSGFDDVTFNPTVSTNATSSVITDQTGNTLKIVHTSKKTANSSSFSLSKLEYSTSTKTTVTTSAISNYLWLKTTKSTGYLLFASFLKTPTESIVSVYDPIKKKTVIYSLPKTLSTVDLNTAVQTLPKGVIIKNTVNGMAMPYLQTDKGQLVIKY